MSEGILERVTPGFEFVGKSFQGVDFGFLTLPSPLHDPNHDIGNFQFLNVVNKANYTLDREDILRSHADDLSEEVNELGFGNGVSGRISSIS